MTGYKYLDKKGTFHLENPELTSYLYFPIANESGVLSCVTPTLGGDSKMGQNTFLLAPVSSEDLHNNKSSRNFWCHIEGRGIWSATGKAAGQEACLYTDKKEEVVLEAGIMWQKVTRISKELGIKSEITSFVPATKDLIELMVVKIENIREEELSFTPTAAIPIYARSADNIRDHRQVTSLLHRIETTETGVVVNPTLTFDERGHQKNTVVYGVFGMTNKGEKPVGFFPCVEDFIGEGGSFENPKAIVDNSIQPVPGGFKIEGYEALGGIRFEKTTLEKNQSITFLIALGYESSKKKLEDAATKYFLPEVHITFLQDTKQYWENKINISYQSGNNDFDSWMHWVHFQPMLRRIYGCSFLPHHDYGKGGRGWRDLWQDCLALLIMNPSGVRDMLIDNFGGVRVDGTNATIIGSKQGEFIADRNNITRVWMDHGAWPFLTTNFYIQQTGDLDILLRQTGYFKDPQAVRGEEKDKKWEQSYGNLLKTSGGQKYEGSILEHLLVQHLTAFYDVGEHNEMQLHGADWNDALDMAKDKGESVAFTAIYGGNLQKMSELIIALKEKGTKTISIAKEVVMLLSEEKGLYESVSRKLKLLNQYCHSCKYTVTGEKVEIACDKLAINILGKAKFIMDHIRKTEWISNKEGHSWYNGYYDNNGRRVEGDVNGGVRMMLTSQVFTIMSGTATTEQIDEITSSADAYLYDKAVGGYRLNTNFHELKTDLGRMFGFAYGHKENGAVFSHMVVMYSNALYQRGYVKEGYKAIYSLYEHCSNFDKSRIYPGVPEYIGENGRGLYHYLTGAASWMLITVLTEMFGIKGNYGDLMLEPKLMWEQFDQNSQATVNFVFADRSLIIQYTNFQKKEYGNYNIGKIFVDGAEYIQKGEKYIIKRKDITALMENNNHLIMVELV